jgi:hypothetical protein
VNAGKNMYESFDINGMENAVPPFISSLLIFQLIPLLCLKTEMSRIASSIKDVLGDQFDEIRLLSLAFHSEQSNMLRNQKPEQPDEAYQMSTRHNLIS